MHLYLYTCSPGVTKYEEMFGFANITKAFEIYAF